MFQNLVNALPNAAGADPNDRLFAVLPNISVADHLILRWLPKRFNEQRVTQILIVPLISYMIRLLLETIDSLMAQPPRSPQFSHIMTTFYNHLAPFRQRLQAARNQGTRDEDWVHTVPNVIIFGQNGAILTQAAAKIRGVRSVPSDCFAYLEILMVAYSFLKYIEKFYDPGDSTTFACFASGMPYYFAASFWRGDRDITTRATDRMFAILLERYPPRLGLHVKVSGRLYGDYECWFDEMTLTGIVRRHWQLVDWTLSQGMAIPSTAVREGYYRFRVQPGINAVLLVTDKEVTADALAGLARTLQAQFDIHLYVLATDRGLTTVDAEICLQFFESGCTVIGEYGDDDMSGKVIKMIRQYTGLRIFRTCPRQPHPTPVPAVVNNTREVLAHFRRMMDPNDAIHGHYLTVGGNGSCPSDDERHVRTATIQWCRDAGGGEYSNNFRHRANVEHFIEHSVNGLREVTRQEDHETPKPVLEHNPSTSMNLKKNRFTIFRTDSDLFPNIPVNLGAKLDLMLSK